MDAQRSTGMDHCMIITLHNNVRISAFHEINFQFTIMSFHIYIQIYVIVASTGKALF